MVVLDSELCFSKDSCKCCLQEHGLGSLDLSQESFFSEEWTKTLSTLEEACNDFSSRSLYYKSFHSIECSIGWNWELQSSSLLHLWFLYLLDQWEANAVSTARLSNAVSHGTQWII